MSLFTILGLVVVSWALLSMVGSERQRLLEALPEEEAEAVKAEAVKAEAVATPTAAPAATVAPAARAAANLGVNSVKKP
jgi:hypothetical protein